MHMTGFLMVVLRIVIIHVFKVYDDKPYDKISPTWCYVYLTWTLFLNIVSFNSMGHITQVSQSYLQYTQVSQSHLQLYSVCQSHLQYNSGIPN